MKTLRYVGMLLMAVVLCVGFNSCSDEEGGGDPIPSGLCGTWKGKGNRGSTTISITFNSDKTGRLTHNANSFSYQYEFTYTCKGNDITTKGVRVRLDHESGEVETNYDWKTYWTYHGDYLTSNINSDISKYTK